MTPENERTPAGPGQGSQQIGIPQGVESNHHDTSGVSGEQDPIPAPGLGDAHGWIQAGDAVQTFTVDRRGELAAALVNEVLAGDSMGHRPGRESTLDVLIDILRLELHRRLAWEWVIRNEPHWPDPDQYRDLIVTTASRHPQNHRTDVVTATLLDSYRQRRAAAEDAP